MKNSKLCNFIKKNKFELILFFSVLILHSFANMNLKALVQAQGGDELGTIASAAFLAGKDWSGVMSVHKYYGFGYSVLMAPFFLIFKSPVTIYQCMLFMNGLLYATTSVFCYRIMGRVLSDKYNIYKLICSIGAMFIPLKFLSVMNEHMLTMLTWVILWCLIRLFEVADEPTRRMKYTAVLTLLLVYSLTIHTRAIILWVSVATTLILYYIFTKRKVVNIKVLLIFGLIGTFLITLIINNMQNILWNKAKRESLANSVGTINSGASKVDLLANPDTWKYFLSNIVSQISGISFVSGGVILVGVVLSIVIIVKTFINHKKISGNQWIYFIISCFSILSIIASILGMSLLWAKPTEDMEWNQMLQFIYGDRIKFYLRYFACYCGPLLVLVEMFIIKERKEISNKFWITNGLLMMLFYGASIYLSGDMYREAYVTSTPAYEIFNIPSLLMGIPYLARRVILFAYMLGLLIFIIWWVLYKKKYYKAMAMVISGVLILQFAVSVVTFNKRDSEAIYLKNYPMYSVIKDMENYTEVPKQIYVPSEETVEYRLQFYLADYTLLPQWPFVDDEPKLVFIRKNELNKYAGKGFVKVDVGENGVLLVQGENLIQAIKDTGRFVYSF